MRVEPKENFSKRIGTSAGYYTHRNVVFCHAFSSFPDGDRYRWCSCSQEIVRLTPFRTTPLTRVRAGRTISSEVDRPTVTGPQLGGVYRARQARGRRSMSSYASALRPHTTGSARGV